MTMQTIIKRNMKIFLFVKPPRKKMHPQTQIQMLMQDK